MFETNLEEVSKGITARINSLKGTEKESKFAQKCNIPISTMRKYLAGSMPGAEKLLLIALANDVSVEWIVTGVENGRVNESPPSDKIDIPILDVEVSAGHGAENGHENTLGTLAFQSQYLASRGLVARDLRVVYAKGDSMEPEIQDGAAMLVNTADARLDEGCIYVISLNDHLFAKRVRRSFDGGVGLISANQLMYPAMEVKPEQLQEMRVLGRVVWSGREH